MQKFVCQPTEPGCPFPYCVAMFDPRRKEYIPLKGELFMTEEEAKQRAHELNEENRKLCDES